MGRIVWINGPFACGEWPDVKIFQNDLKHMLKNGEMVETDDGYAIFGRPDDRCCICKVPTDVPGHARGQARARHEAINGRLKGFNVLRNQFHHDPAYHGICVHAVALIIQSQMIMEKPIWKVCYPGIRKYTTASQEFDEAIEDNGYTNANNTNNVNADNDDNYNNDEGNNEDNNEDNENNNPNNVGNNQQNL